MFKFLRTLTLSAIVGLGAVAALPATADAAGGSIYLGFGASDHGPSARFRFDDRGHHHYRGPDRHGPGRYHARECSPREAVRKAARMGLRDARVVDASRRTVKVAGKAAGRGHGLRPAVIVFGNAPSCPILR